MTALKPLRLSAHERIHLATENVLLQLEDIQEGVEPGKLRLLITDVLTAAVEEVIGVFEEAVVGCEERPRRSEQQVCRHHQLLQSLFNPRVLLERADIQQLLPTKKEVSIEHPGKSSSMILKEPLNEEMQGEEEDKGCDCEGLDSDDDLTFAAEKPSDSLGHGRQNMSKDEKLHSSKHKKMQKGSFAASAESDLGKTHYTCSLCGEKFARLIGLSYHLKIHKRKRERRKTKIEGPVCHKDMTRSHLKYHNLIHTGTKPFSCDNCNKRFRWPSQIRNHNCVQRPLLPPVKNMKPLTCCRCGAKYFERALMAHKCPPKPFPSQGQSKTASLSAIKTSVKTHGPNYERQRKTGCNGSTKPPGCPDNEVQTELGECWQEQTPLASTMIPVKACDGCIERRIQMFPCKGDLSQYAAFHTEVQEEVKQENAELSQVQEEKGIVKFTFCHVPVKAEEGDEKPQASQLLYSKTEENLGSVKEPEPEPGQHPHFQHQTSNSSDTDVSDGEWEDTSKAWTGSNCSVDSALGNKDEQLYICPTCGISFRNMECMKNHIRTHTGEKPFSCIVCHKSFKWLSQIRSHKCGNDNPEPNCRG